jgi:hypothetical protein
LAALAISVKGGLGISLPESNPEKVLFWQPNCLVECMIAIISLKKQFYQKSGYTRPHDKASLRTSGQHLPVVVSQWKGRGDMDITPPGMGKNPSVV